MDPEELSDMVASSQRHQANQQLRNLAAQLERQRRGVAPCPHCGGGLPQIGVGVCMHCREKLAWYQTLVGKGGEEELLKRKYQKDQAALSERKIQDSINATREAEGQFNLVSVLTCVWLTWVGISWLSTKSQRGFLDRLLLADSGMLLESIGILSSIFFGLAFVIIVPMWLMRLLRAFRNKF